MRLTNMAPSTRVIAVLAAPLLVAGTVAGFLVAGGSLDKGLGLSPSAQDAAEAAACSAPGEVSFPSEAQVESWSGDVPADAEGGTVQASGWWGGVHVAPSDGDTYSVEIAEVDDRDELEPRVEAEVEDGVFSLVAVVEHANKQDAGPATVSVGTSPDAEAHVKVRVPDKVYESIDADSTVDQEIKVSDNGTDADVRLHPRVDAEPQDDGSGTADNPVRVGSLQADHVTVDAYNRPVAAADVAAQDLKADSHNGQAVLSNLEATGDVSAYSYNGAACAQTATAGTLHLDTHNGPAHAEAVEAAEIDMYSYNGAVTGQGLQTAEVVADSHNGAVDVEVAPTDSGEIEAYSQNGDTTVTVATGPAYGYDAEAYSQNGDAEVDLPGAQSQGDDTDSSWSSSDRARTDGYEDREIQVEVEANSHNGDALVTG